MIKFGFQQDSVCTPPCAHEGCTKPGLYKAPKDRAHQTHYIWFCLEHIRAYNARWDYLRGLTESEIEKFIRNGVVWERATWPFAKAPSLSGKNRRRAGPKDALPAPILAALAVLDLTPPVSWASVQARQRKLVKKLHPDTAAQADTEKFMAVQQAFATLRAFYAKTKKTPLK